MGERPISANVIDRNLGNANDILENILSDAGSELHFQKRIWGWRDGSKVASASLLNNDVVPFWENKGNRTMRSLK